MPFELVNFLLVKILDISKTSILGFKLRSEGEPSDGYLYLKREA